MFSFVVCRRKNFIRFFCLFVISLIISQPIYFLYVYLENSKYVLAEKFIRPKIVEKRHEVVWKKIERFKKLDSFDKWSTGLLGKSIDNSVTRNCEIPFGKWDFNFKVWQKNRIKMTRKVLTGDNHDFLEVFIPDSENSFLENCKRQFDGKKITLLDINIQLQCPFYFFLKDKNTRKPYFEGMLYPGKKVKIPNQEELIIVTYNGKSNGLVRISRQKKSIKTENNNKKPNLHIFLVDSISRTHFHRMMDETGKTLQNIHLNDETDYSFVEFFKYHTVDYSSNSNMTPFMTGENWWDFCRHKFRCNFSKNIQFNKFIWDVFKKQGYKTAISMEICWAKYQADWFFVKKSWDHYFGVPLGDLTSCMIDGEPECVFGKRPHKYLFDFMSQFNELYKNDPKFHFQLFLESHEVTGRVSRTLDSDLAKNIQSITSKNENTWIFIMSDHGLHYGKFYDKHKTGTLEQRLPFVGALVPKQFQIEYPKKYANFKKNSQKLVTNYDFYEFLHEFSALEKPTTSKPYGKWGISLFDKIPNDRTCKEANIPEYICICNKKLHQVQAGWRECGNDPKTQQLCHTNFKL
eukprot:gene8321-145_t